MGQAHGQGVVSHCGAAGPDAQARADADEQGAQQGGQQRIVYKSGPQLGELLKKSVTQGEACGGEDGIADECFAQDPPTKKEAGAV